MGAKDKRAACVEAAGDSDMLFFEGLDCAIIGWSERDGETVAVYCAKRVVGELVKQGWTRGDAWEHLGNNIIGAWMGPRTPVVVHALRRQSLIA